MKKILLIATLLLPSVLNAQWTDEYGTWISVGAKKSLGTQWSLGLEAEYRAQDNSRWAVGLDAGYKLNKYLKFGAGYTLLYNRKGRKEGNSYLTPAYAYPRHRFIVEGTADKRFWKWLRISLRERYQLTYRPEHTYDRYAKVYDFDEDWNPIEYWSDEAEPKTKASTTTQLLRSRLKLEVDKKGWKFAPFASAELCNSVRVGDRFDVDKVRTTVGTSYKFNKQHEISLAYVLSFDFNEDDGKADSRIHAVNIGYNFKF